MLEVVVVHRACLVQVHTNNLWVNSYYIHNNVSRTRFLTELQASVVALQQWEPTGKYLDVVHRFVIICFVCE